MTIKGRALVCIALTLALVMGLSHPAQAGALDNWHWRDPGNLYVYQGAAFINGSHVIVGWHGTIMTSPDGVSWTSQVSGVTSDLWGVVQGGGKVVAIGDSGVILTSTDGSNWSARPSTTTEDLYGITHADSTFVCVGSGGTILTSPDGSAWTQRVSGTTEDLNGVAYGAGKFVAVGQNGTIITSSDGTNWATQAWTGALGPVQHMRDVTHGNGVFVAVGSIGKLLTSPDGVTWTNRVVTSNYLMGAAFGGGSFVVAGFSRTILSSPDGITWTPRTCGTHGSGSLQSVDYCNGTFFIGEQGGVYQSDPFTPPAPSGLTATPLSTDSVKLQWQDNSSNETSFRIEQKTGSTWAEIDTGPQDWGQYTVTGLSAGTTYSFRVRAHNVLGYSPYSNEASGTTHSASGGGPMSNSPPAAPSGLSATAGPGTSIKLTWHDNANNENGFIIERRTGAEPFVQIGTSPQDWGQYTDATIMAGTTYDYRVAAYNVYGPSAYVQVSHAVPGGAPGGPTGPTGPGPDVSTASPWAQPEIQQAWSYGLTTDRILSNYQDPITREEFCEIALLLYESLSSIPAQPADPNPFVDTSNPAILKAYALGITKGVSPTQFAPLNQISRQEIAVMLYRTLEAALPASVVMDLSGVPTFADEHLIASWAIKEVRYWYQNDIMKGTGGLVIDPLGQTTREQAIALVKRIYEIYTI